MFIAILDVSSKLPTPADLFAAIQAGSYVIILALGVSLYYYRDALKKLVDRHFGMIDTLREQNEEAMRLLYEQHNVLTKLIENNNRLTRTVNSNNLILNHLKNATKQDS